VIEDPETRERKRVDDPRVIEDPETRTGIVSKILDQPVRSGGGLRRRGRFSGIFA